MKQLKTHGRYSLSPPLFGYGYGWKNAMRGNAHGLSAALNRPANAARHWHGWGIKSTFMNQLKTLWKALQSHTHGTFKVVTRAHGVTASQLCYSLMEARAIAKVARESGQTAQVYELRGGEWVEVNQV